MSRTQRKHATYSPSHAGEAEQQRRHDTCSTRRNWARVTNTSAPRRRITRPRRCVERGAAEDDEGRTEVAACGPEESHAAPVAQFAKPSSARRKQRQHGHQLDGVVSTTAGESASGAVGRRRRLRDRNGQGFRGWTKTGVRTRTAARRTRAGPCCYFATKRSVFSSLFGRRPPRVTSASPSGHEHGFSACFSMYLVIGVASPLDSRRRTRSARR